MPLEFVIAAGAGQVQQDAAKAALDEEFLHIDPLISWLNPLFSLFSFLPPDTAEKRAQPYTLQLTEQSGGFVRALPQVGDRVLPNTILRAMQRSQSATRHLHAVRYQPVLQPARLRSQAQQWLLTLRPLHQCPLSLYPYRLRHRSPWPALLQHYPVMLLKPSPQRRRSTPRLAHHPLRPTRS
jgi:hypothetical protein